MALKLKILSFNIHKGLCRFNRRVTLEKIRQAIREVHADVVFLQEVVGHNGKHARRFKEWVSTPQFEYLADSVWPYYSYAKNAVYKEGHHGNVILSKYPIVQWDKFDISENRFEQRGVLYTQIGPKGEDGRDWPPVDLFCLHLNLFHRHRRRQYQKICQLIQQLSGQGRTVILAGDLNDWNRRASSAFESELGMSEAFKSSLGHYAKSFPASRPWLSLDRVYLRGADVLACQTCEGKTWANLSDHLPLLVEVALPEQRGRDEELEN